MANTGPLKVLDRILGSNYLAIEAALFESGRPVLVVPYIQSTGIKLDRVMVCWDGSRNAARAVADAAVAFAGPARAPDAPLFLPGE